MSVREAFTSPKHDVREIEVEGVGPVYLRKVSWAAALELQQLSEDERMDGMNRLVVKSLAEADGSRVFSDDEVGDGVRALLDLPADAVTELIEAVTDMNKLGDAGLEEAVGNSGTPQA